MSISLITNEKIRTTLPKAKELRRNVERLITLGKRGTLHARRLAISSLRHKETVKKLFGQLQTRYANRHGGYTRIIRLGKRMGDAASMAIIELVDRVETPKEIRLKAKEEATSKPTEKVK
jgi:large subunit ribosomal protein L17